VASSFETILEVDQVGINDDFFKLGGHSLRALRLVNLLEERTGKEVQIKHIFESSRVVELANVLESLGEGTYERIPEAEEKSAYAMSSTQKRMYLLWKLSPQEVAYNIPTIITFDNRVDEESLSHAVDQLAKRHEILRTTFHEQDGDLVQVIHDEMKVAVQIDEIKGANILRWYERAVRPFDLETGPLCRLQIARTETNDYLFVDMHHIISDGKSSTIFASEINQLMSNMPLPTLDRQYKDYSEWMKTQDIEISENYWMNSLEEYPILTLPTDFVRPSEKQFEGFTEKLIIDEETTRKIKGLLQKTNTTAYMFFMSIISVLLGKLANQNDLVIGSPVSGRVHKDTETMLGMFVNTWAMRVRPEGEKNFSSYLEELKAQTLTAQTHQIYPFEDLVDQMVQTRDRSRNPLFDVMVVYQNNEEISPIKGADNFEEMNVPAKFDLNFALSDDGKETTLLLTYSASLFKQETILATLRRLTQLLDQVLTDEEQSIKDLTILLEEEAQLFIESEGAQIPYPADKTIVEIFEEQVAANPNQNALIYQDTTLTYAELNAKANQLAHYLIDTYDIKPEDKVGLLLDRSEWMIISILGVLKAGGAYVPISPEFPKERKSYIEQEAEFKTALVEAHYSDDLSNVTIVKELDLEEYPTTSPMTTLTSTNLAYVIFTSGTTGNPKGVMLEHHNVNNLIPSLWRDYEFENDGERLLFFSNYVFDVSVEQIFLALLNGCPLIVSPDDLWMDQEAFTAYLNEHEVTYIHMTPSLLSQIDVSGVTSLRRVVVAGESVNPALVRRMHEQGIKFINGYGPTEATVIATTYIFDGPEERNIIGKPVANTIVYILDEWGRPVPRGTRGDMYLGGVQLARGYINQSELTAEKFIPNPFQTEAQKVAGWNERIYETGDLVHMNQDGTIEYHGRNDFQVKIRGYRIELGEIEAALLSISGVTQAYVMATIPEASKEAGREYLAAYYVSEQELSQAYVDEQLTQKLPSYMIPSGYQHMAEFPLTVNGKLDRRALPHIGFDSAAEYIAPTTEMETLVATSYEEILELDRIGINDEFFQLGGHSLRALKLVNLLKERTGKAVEVIHVFEFPKVGQLAKHIESLKDLVYERLPKAQEKPFYDMSPSQKRLYRFWKYTENGNGVGNNMPMILKFKERLDEQQVQSAFETLVARHEIYRTTFHEQDGKYIQMIHTTMPVAIPVVQIQEADVADWFNETVQSFDLEKGPLYRAIVARTETHDHLFVDIHHIISDGRSHTNLTREMIQLFKGATLPPLDRQFKDYSEWVKTLDLSDSEDYWLESMRDYPVLALELDYPRPAVQDFAVGKDDMILDEVITGRIRDFVKETNTTEYMFFLAVIGILLSKLADQEELVIGSPMTGRIHRDIEDMLGMIVNSLPMRIAPASEKSFLNYLEEIRAQTLAVYDHQIYPLDMLKEKLVKTPDPSRHALYDVLYVYQNNEVIDIETLGLVDYREYDLPEKLDLNYTLSPNGKEILVSLTYATALFKPETMQAYQVSLRKLVEQILTAKESRIRDLEI